MLRSVYPRKRFRVADNALLYYRAPHYRNSSHDGHTRVLLAFYTPSVTSKSLLISLLFLEREGVYFLLALSYPSFESARGTAPCFTCFLQRPTDQHYTLDLTRGWFQGAS